MKGLIIGAILGLLLGLTLVTIDGWSFAHTTTKEGFRENIIGGAEEYYKGTMKITQEKYTKPEPVQIIFKLGLLMTGFGLGLGIGSFFDEGVDDEDNNT